ncbi:site-specific integrase [Luteibacter sp. ME-Dv--P-043b]|uniref:site-specific integrase n=1 Tax=Luteibacter sp. ME-Dv--P-043b TaxID=3040291 RepID=UPI0025545864|nr:site-specific integrase [Luteibacter sp. ME-Dv--P-043b]
MLLASFPSPAPYPPPLYDFHAGPEGIRLSPRSAEGHACVLELCERLGLEKAVAAGQSRALLEDDILARVFGRPLPAPTPPLAPAPGPVSQEAAPEPALEPGSVNTLGSPAEPAAAPQPAGATGKRLGELVRLHLANVARGPKRATPATRDRGYALDLLVQVLGDRPAADLTPDDASNFADFLAIWPARRHHLHQLDGLDALAVAARAKREKLPPISLGTQRKHLGHINALMNAAIKSGDLAENPFRYVDLARYSKDEHGRRRKKKDIFHHADLTTIFASTHMAKLISPHKYWVPLIAHFTGMRVNEICQLYLDDVRVDPYLDETGQERNVMTFDITADRAGQSVKTDYGIRRIPIPRAILDLGFERYLADVRASGSEVLFPGLRWAEGGPGQTLSEWFNGTHLRKTCEITSKRKTLHCFRHNLTTLMDRTKVPESIICAINGHSTGVSIDRRNYIADGTVLECQRVLDALPFPELALEPYVSSRFAGYLEHAAAEREREARALAEGTEFKPRKGPRPRLPTGDSSFPAG